MGKEQHLVAILLLTNLLMSLACKCPPCPAPKAKPPHKPPAPPRRRAPPRSPPAPYPRPPPPVAPPPPPVAPYPSPPPPVAPPPRRRAPPPPPVAPYPSPPPPVAPPPPPRAPPPYTPPAPPIAPAPAGGACPIDALKLGACVDALSSLVHVIIGTEVKNKCCPVIQGLLGLDAAVCFCTAIRAKLLNISLILPIALQLILGCGKSVSPDFRCPPQF